MTDADAGIHTVYADNDLLVLNKPAGLLSVPGRGEDKQDCLSRRVQQLYPDALVVHRLDMATSGLLLMARGSTMQASLNRLFACRAVHKRYVAVVEGDLHANQSVPADREGWHLIDLPIAIDWPRRPLRTVNISCGKPSQTRWRWVCCYPNLNATRIELEPVTGRSHQLRVHLQALGHPILGDGLYAPGSVQAKAPRLLLHAAVLAFVHPLNQQPLKFECSADF